MSPYAFKTARLVGGAVFSVSAIESIFKISNAGQEVSPILLLCLAAGGLAAYVIFYFWQISEIDKLIGIYVHARTLRRISEPLARALRIHPYHRYYAKRPADDDIRENLKANDGVVILGLPFSGKTRAALEAITETHPVAHVISFTSPDRMTLETIKEIVLP